MEIVRMAKEWLQEPEPDNGTVGELDVDEITVMIAGLVDKVESLTTLCDGYRGEDRVECIACPECHSEEYVNADLLGRGHRECKQCGQDWWTDINYGKIDIHTKPLEAEIKRLQSALTRARAEGMYEASRIMKVRAANAMRRYHDGQRGEVPASVIMALPLVTEQDAAAIRAKVSDAP